MRLDLDTNERVALTILLNRELELDPKSRAYTPDEWDRDVDAELLAGRYDTYIETLTEIRQRVEEAP